MTRIAIATLIAVVPLWAAATPAPAQSLSFSVEGDVKGVNPPIQVNVYQKLIRLTVKESLTRTVTVDVLYNSPGPYAWFPGPAYAGPAPIDATVALMIDAMARKAMNASVGTFNRIKFNNLYATSFFSTSYRVYDPSSVVLSVTNPIPVAGGGTEGGAVSVTAFCNGRITNGSLTIRTFGTITLRRYKDGMYQNIPCHLLRESALGNSPVSQASALSFVNYALSSSGIDGMEFTDAYSLGWSDHSRLLHLTTYRAAE